MTMAGPTVANITEPMTPLATSVVRNSAWPAISAAVTTARLSHRIASRSSSSAFSYRHHSCATRPSSVAVTIADTTDPSWEKAVAISPDATTSTNAQ